MWVHLLYYFIMLCSLFSLPNLFSQFIRSTCPTLCLPHGLQHDRLPCSSPALGACSNSQYFREIKKNVDQLNWSNTHVKLCIRTFSKSACTSGSSQLNCWSLAWKILSILFYRVDLYDSLNILWHCSSFQFCGHCWVFQIWHIECNTLTTSYFRILK